MSDGMIAKMHADNDQTCGIFWTPHVVMSCAFLWYRAVSEAPGRAVFTPFGGREIGLQLGWALAYVWSFSVCYLTPWGRDKMATIFQMTFPKAFSWTKMSEFRLRFNWNLFPRLHLTIIPALIQTTAWRLSGDKPLSGPMMVNLLTHLCVTRSQWVNSLYIFIYAGASKAKWSWWKIFSLHI